MDKNIKSAIVNFVGSLDVSIFSRISLSRFGGEQLEKLTVGWNDVSRWWKIPTSFPKDHAISFDLNKNKSTEESVLLECWEGSSDDQMSRAQSMWILCYWRHPSSDVLPLTISYWWLQQRLAMKVGGKSSVGMWIFTIFSQCLRPSSRGLAAWYWWIMWSFGFVWK